MNLETKITIYKFTPQVFTLTLEKGSGGRFSLKTWGNPKSCFGFKRKLIKVAFTHCMY